MALRYLSFENISMVLGFGREMVDIRVCMEFGMAGVGNGRESAKWKRLIGNFVVSAKKKLKNRTLICHCCERTN